MLGVIEPLSWLGGSVWLTLWTIGSIRRFHDQDMSGWFTVLWWALILSPWVAAYLVRPSALGPAAVMFVIPIGWHSLVPGTVGPNRFGPDPRTR